MAPMTWFAHRCNFCGHKSREVEFVVGDRVWQCVWENRDACYERRRQEYWWEQHPTIVADTQGFVLAVLRDDQLDLIAEAVVRKLREGGQ